MASVFGLPVPLYDAAVKRSAEAYSVGKQEHLKIPDGP
jgi:hypothetical protein